jgi:hypothetical protein
MTPEISEALALVNEAFHRQLQASTAAAKAGDHDRALRERDVAAGFAGSAIMIETVGKKPQRFRTMELFAFASLPMGAASMASRGEWAYFAFGIVLSVTFVGLVWTSGRRKR